jgi:hypothetical protein
MRTLTRRQLLETLGSTVGSALVLDALSFPEKTSAPVLRVKEELDAVEIDNGLVRARFRKLPHGIEQEYSALDADGRWTIVARSLHPGRPRPSGCAPLYADQNVAGAYRLLAADGLRSVRIAQKADGHVQVEMRGVLEGNEIEQSVLLERGENYLHIEVRAVLAVDPPRLEYLFSTFCFVGGALPDFTHVPCLKRATDDVIGDRIFDAPAVILQKGGDLAALLPDLDLLNQDVVYAKGARPVEGTRGFQVPQDPAHISMPAIMDLDLKSGLTPDPIFAFGLADFITEQHVFWRHENKQGAMVRELARNQLRYGFDLFLRADAPAQRGYQQVSRYLWERYGALYFQQPRPQAMPFSEYTLVQNRF